MNEVMAKRIHLARINRGLTMEELGARIGVKKATIYKYERGIIGNMKRGKIESLARALDVNPVWLMGLTDEGEIIPSNLFTPTFKSVPILGKIACGTPILAQENQEGSAPVSEHIAADFALWCRGDSMAPRFEDGDLVFLRQQDDVDPGQIAAVLIDDEATLKHVYKAPGQLTLVADNPAYPPLIYSDPVTLQSIRILGLVTGYQRAIRQ